MRTRLMSLLTRWCALPLLILLIDAAAVSAQSSFLDELRIERPSESVGDEEVPPRFSYATSVDQRESALDPHIGLGQHARPQGK